MLPLIAVAAGAGIARTAFGIAKAGKQNRADRDLIKRAYQIAKNRKNLQQADTRQNLTESLNARGILNGGDNVQASPEVATASRAAGVDPDAATKAAIAQGGGAGAIVRSLKGRAGRQADYEQARMAADSTRGQTGQGNTLGGQAESDLSKEFLLEHQDLFNAREQAITGTKRQQTADVTNAIGSGIDVGTSVYNAGNLIKGALSGGAKPPTAPAPSESGKGTSLGGSFWGGYDPVDPLGISKRGISNSQFNVKKG